MTVHPGPRPDHPHARRRRVGLLVGLLVGLALLGTAAAPVAFAHTDLSSSDPGDGATVDQPPGRLVLVFADAVGGTDPVLTITVDGFAPVEAPAVIDGATVTADLSGVDLPGLGATYPVTWDVGYALVASDGDAFTGGISFAVAAGPVPAVTEQTSAVATTAGETTAGPATTPPTTAATTTPSSASPGSATAASSSAPAASSTADPGTTVSTSAANSSAAAGNAAADSGRGSGWWWFGGVVVVVLLAGAAYWFNRSRRNAPPAA